MSARKEHAENNERNRQLLGKVIDKQNETLDGQNKALALFMRIQQQQIAQDHEENMVALTPQKEAGRALFHPSFNTSSGPMPDHSESYSPAGYDMMRAKHNPSLLDTDDWNRVDDGGGKMPTIDSSLFNIKGVETSGKMGAVDEAVVPPPVTTPTTNGGFIFGGAGLASANATATNSGFKPSNAGVIQSFGSDTRPENSGSTESFVFGIKPSDERNLSLFWSDTMASNPAQATSAVRHSSDHNAPSIELRKGSKRVRLE
jgi:hypothetical protein